MVIVAVLIVVSSGSLRSTCAARCGRSNGLAGGRRRARRPVRPGARRRGRRRPDVDDIDPRASTRRSRPRPGPPRSGPARRRRRRRSGSRRRSGRHPPRSDDPAPSRTRTRSRRRSRSPPGRLTVAVPRVAVVFTGRHDQHASRRRRRRQRARPSAARDLLATVPGLGEIADLVPIDLGLTPPAISSSTPCSGSSGPRPDALAARRRRRRGRGAGHRRDRGDGVLLRPAARRTEAGRRHRARCAPPASPATTGREPRRRGPGRGVAGRRRRGPRRRRRPRRHDRAGRRRHEDPRLGVRHVPEPEPRPARAGGGRAGRRWTAARGTAAPRRRDAGRRAGLPRHGDGRDGRDADPRPSTPRAPTASSSPRPARATRTRRCSPRPRRRWPTACRWSSSTRCPAGAAGTGYAFPGGGATWQRAGALARRSPDRPEGADRAGARAGRRPGSRRAGGAPRRSGADPRPDFWTAVAPTGPSRRDRLMPLDLLVTGGRIATLAGDQRLRLGRGRRDHGRPGRVRRAPRSSLETRADPHTPPDRARSRRGRDPGADRRPSPPGRRRPRRSTGST